MGGMTFRPASAMGRLPAPPHDLVLSIAAEEAERVGSTLGEVLGVGRTRVAIRGRKRAWRRLVLEERYTIVGVARVWGCHRRGIQRALASGAAA